MTETQPPTPLAVGERQAIAEAALSELPKARWSCSDDESGTALTLARQRKWSFNAVRAAILSLDSPSLGEGAQDWSFLPKQIGRLELGERPSDNECYCEHSHVVPDGAPLYWPQGMGQYDDSNAYCLEHAIELAESDSSWCQTCIAADLAAEAHIPTTNAPVADQVLTLDQRVARICNNELSGWWNSLTDVQRHGLKSGSISMLDWAFEAGVRASLTKNVATNADMRGALEPFARQPTTAEIHAGEGLNEWLEASVGRRIEMMGERRRENDANILRARTVLQGDQS